ncbi:MAG: hypothetical protein J5835_02280 [Bacteroidales bacterium]|nr:hypothetical protein [Bacteroidales bacterium]
MNRKTYYRISFFLVAMVLGIWAVSSVKSCIREKRWLAQGVIENHPRRVYDVKFSREFNDMNDVQLLMAQAIGVLPVADRNAAEHSKKKLVKLEDTDSYVIDSLTHSIPYLIPSAKRLLDRIGSNFLDSLSSKGLNPNKLVITSVLRTEDDIKKLRRRNMNASENSTHRYGTTFDISYWHYVKVPDLRGRPYEDVPPEYLRAVLSQVLKDLHDRKECYVKYERKQTCFHVTVRE